MAITKVVGAWPSDDEIRRIFYDEAKLLIPKIKHLYDTDFLRWYESEYGTDELKDLVLVLLSQIDSFDDCIVVTDFTNFNWTGTSTYGLSSGDTYSVNKTSDYTEINLTTDSNSGERDIWTYYNLATSAKAIFVSATIQPPPVRCRLDVCNADGSTFENPPDFYRLAYRIHLSNADFAILKSVSGSGASLAEEAVNLTAGVDYKTAFYISTETGTLMAWRDSDPLVYRQYKLKANDTSITSLASVRFMLYEIRTNTTTVTRIKAPFIIAWKV